MEEEDVRMNKVGKITVIYDRITGFVLATEQEGIWTLPSGLDVAEFRRDSKIFSSDEHGNVYLKTHTMYPGERPS